MNILYKYLSKDIVNYVLADYLLPTEQFNKVMNEIKQYNVQRHGSFRSYYCFLYKVRREKTDIRYFKECLKKDNVYMKYNPFPSDPYITKLYNRYMNKKGLLIHGTLLSDVWKTYNIFKK